MTSNNKEHNESSDEETSGDESLQEHSEESLEEASDVESDPDQSEASEASDDDEQIDDSSDSDIEQSPVDPDDSEDSDHSDDSEGSDDSEDSEGADNSDDSDESDGSEASDDSSDSEDSDDSGDVEESDDEDSQDVVAAGDGGDDIVGADADGPSGDDIEGMAAFFDVPDELMLAAAHTRDSDYEQFDAFSPFPIHGMDEAMGLGRSWLPWVTFGAGLAGFVTANALQFGTMTFDWPMIIGGKPFAPIPAFVPIMFELSVLFAGVITAIVMLIAAGCFKKPMIIDPEITSDRFALWISADDEAFHAEEVRQFMETLDPVEIRTITNEGA